MGLLDNLKNGAMKGVLSSVAGKSGRFKGRV